MKDLSALSKEEREAFWCDRDIFMSLFLYYATPLCFAKCNRMDVALFRANNLYRTSINKLFFATTRIFEMEAINISHSRNPHIYKFSSAIKS